LFVLTEKPRPDGLALAFQGWRPGQSHHEAIIRARLGLAYLGLAWLGSRPQAGPGTALAGMTIGEVVLELLSSNHPSVESISKNLEKILDTLTEHNESTQQRAANNIFSFIASAVLT
jgi:hypothetical protein